MSIDGIGRPPIPPGGPGSVAGPGASPEANEAFQVKPSAEAQPGAPANLLSRLQSGELSLDQYLDLRVQEAVAPLVSRLRPEQIEIVKGTLRAELETDPVLIELVQRATGMSPPGAER